MKKIVRTVELTWEKEVSITISRRRVWSDMHEESAKGVDDDTGDRKVDVHQLELVGERDEKRNR